MFKLKSLSSLTYQQFGEFLDTSGESFYQKVMMALNAGSDKELARSLGISEQAVNNAKRSGKIPDRWLMYAVCRSGFALPLLLTLSDEELGMAIADPDKFTYRLVPLVKTLQFPESEGWLPYVESYLALRTSTTRRAEAKNDELLAVVVKGYSLEPVIKSGDTILITLSQRQFTPGGIYVINLDGTRLLCRLHKLPGRYRVMFDNPSIQDFEVEEVDIFGKVLLITKEV